MYKNVIFEQALVDPWKSLNSRWCTSDLSISFKFNEHLQKFRVGSKREFCLISACYLIYISMIITNWKTWLHWSTLNNTGIARALHSLAPLTAAPPCPWGGQGPVPPCQSSQGDLGRWTIISVFRKHGRLTLERIAIIFHGAHSWHKWGWKSTILEQIFTVKIQSRVFGYSCQK